MCLNKQCINRCPSTPKNKEASKDDSLDRNHDVTSQSSPKHMNDRAAPDVQGFSLPCSPVLRSNTDGTVPSLVPDVPQFNVEKEHEEDSPPYTSVYLSWPQPFIQTFSSRKLSCSSVMTERTSDQLSNDSVHSSATTISSMSGLSVNSSASESSSLSKRVIFPKFWRKDGEIEYMSPNKKPARKGILRKSSYGEDINDDDDDSSKVIDSSRSITKQVRFYSNVLCIVPDRVDKVEPALCWWTPEELKETQRQLVSDLIQTNLGYNALLHCRGVLSIEITSAMNDFYNLTF